MENASSPVVIVDCNQGNTSYEESEAPPAVISEEPTTPPPQEAVNPSQKVVKEKCFHGYIFLVNSFSSVINIGPQWTLAS